MIKKKDNEIIFTNIKDITKPEVPIGSYIWDGKNFKSYANWKHDSIYRLGEAYSLPNKELYPPVSYIVNVIKETGEAINKLVINKADSCEHDSVTNYVIKVGFIVNHLRGALAKRLEKIGNKIKSLEKICKK